MAIAYDPKDAIMVLPEGEYNAVLKKVEEKQSKAGNDMCVLTWEVHPEDARPAVLVSDYIVFPAFTFKLKRLAQSMGKLQEFEDKTFQPEDYQGSSTRVFLRVAKQDGYDDKNEIKSYVAPTEPRSKPWIAAANVPAKEPAFAADEKVDASLIPF